MAYALRPAGQDEKVLFHRMEDEQAVRYGAIGHLCVDFGKSGKEFQEEWSDTQSRLNMPAFKREFNDILDSLRNDGDEPPFESRGSLQKFLFANQGLPLQNSANGFKIQTPNYTYAVHCAPFRGDYDVRVFAYDNRWLMPELEGKNELLYDCVGASAFADEPENTSEIIGGYCVMAKTAAGDRIIQFGHDPTAAEPYATWECSRDGNRHNSFWHYWKDEHKAKRDFFQRIDYARTGRLGDYTVPAYRDKRRDMER